MGGGSRFPYPKEVWSPAGGWWTRPSNWKSNTAIAFAGILVITYGAFAFCADREWRYVEPARPIPSMKWSKQYKDRQSESTQEEHS
ncbi:unnamed protein product [Somion occarium]|uniref:Uncharacterized protein n=1 Tax=Somion occarium TaxID=3059160 RepID=A0ABP1DQK1_9APHY